MVNIFIKLIYEHATLMLFPTEQLIHTDWQIDFCYFDIHISLRHQSSMECISDIRLKLKVEKFYASLSQMVNHCICRRTQPGLFFNISALKILMKDHKAYVVELLFDIVCHHENYVLSHR